MALVDCKDCGAQVSNEAYDCPKCGARLRKPKRSMFGSLVKYSFIGYNILMLLWFVLGVGAASEAIDNSSSDAEQVGATIGTGLGAMMIIFIWVSGAVILGLLTIITKPKKH